MEAVIFAESGLGSSESCVGAGAGVEFDRGSAEPCFTKFSRSLTLFSSLGMIPFQDGTLRASAPRDQYLFVDSRRAGDDVRVPAQFG